ncbi:MAG: GNAT family N-acetyltransferase [Candidatus Limnocylindrales bacterium]
MGTCDGIVHIRRAIEADARGIAEVHVRTWQQAYRGTLPLAFLQALSVDTREVFWRDELHALAPDRRPWVAETGRGIVGFVSAGLGRDEAAPPLTGEVYAMYVLPDCWDRGVGRTLLAHAEHDLVDHGYSEAEMWILSDNDRARGFYEKAGWRADGGIKRVAIGGEEFEEVRYRLTLEKSNVAGLI